MKSEALHAWLDSHVKLLVVACSERAAADVAAFLPILLVAKTMDVSKLCKVIDGSIASERSDIVGRASKLIGLMVACAEHTAKASSTDLRDLRLFADTINRNQGLDLPALSAAIYEKLAPTPRNAPQAAAFTDADVRSWVRKLEEALGDDAGFESLFANLSKDKRVKGPEAKKIAKAFAGKSGRSKSDALGLIWGRHAALIGSQARATATAGRTAA